MLHEKHIQILTKKILNLVFNWIINRSPEVGKGSLAGEPSQELAVVQVDHKGDKDYLQEVQKMSERLLRN